MYPSIFLPSGFARIIDACMLPADQPLETKRIGPLWQESQYRDTKDPCPVFDGKQWHIFGSGGMAVSDDPETRETWDLLHATAPAVHGPWTEQPSIVLEGLNGLHVAAPGV